VFPTDVLDNRAHLQALRHLWVLAVEGRCLVARDGDAGGTVVGGVTGHVYLKDGTTQILSSPGLLPEFDTIKHIEVRSEGFWDGHIDFEVGAAPSRETMKKENAVNVVLRRRAAYDKPAKDLFTTELQARAEAMGIPSIDPNAVPSYALPATSSSHHSTSSANPFEWLFDLPSMRDFDYAERALVLGPTPIDAKELLRTTVVDSRLQFEKGILPNEDGKGVEQGRMQKDKLWQLRLLFAWFDRWEREDEETERKIQAGGEQFNEQVLSPAGDKWFSENGGTWLRREVIERLRWRVWNMTTGGAGDQGELDDEHEDL